MHWLNYGIPPSLGRSYNAYIRKPHRQGSDWLVHQVLTVLITINHEKSLLWDPDPGFVLTFWDSHCTSTLLVG